MDRRGITVVAGPEWDAAIARLREVDETMVDRLRDAMRKLALPIEADLKRAALALPARRGKHSGLRARVAAGVGAELRTGHGAGLRFTTQMDNPQEAELPRGLDNGVRGWRHPVFGHRDTWVHQRGGSWFRETISDDRDEIERNILDVLEEARDSIARSS